MDTIAEMTTSTPALDGQDGPEGIGQDNPAPDTATTVAAARTAHAAAIANADAARERASLAEAAHRRAIADRQRLLDKAAAGDAVDPTDLRRAGIATNDMKDAHDLAAAIARGAGSLAEKAHIAVLAAEADHVMDVHEAAINARLEAAEAVDIAKAEYERLVQAFNSAGFQLALTRNAIGSHNQNVGAAMTINRTLASLEPSALPTARQPVYVPTTSVVVPPLILIAHRMPDAQPASVAAHVRGQHGIPAADAAETAAKAEAAAAFQANVMAQVLAGIGKGPPSFTPTDGRFRFAVPR